jgi:hypothetical protein
MSYCELMTKPCEFAPPYGPVTPRKCDICMAHYTMKELRKIKDELKLLNTRMVDIVLFTEYKEKDCAPKLHYHLQDVSNGCWTGPQDSNKA